MKILIAGDDKAWSAVEAVIAYMQRNKIDYENVGAQNADDPIGLTEFIPKVCDRVKQASAQGILLCGTGAGVEIGANRFKGIRASLCLKPIQAQWAREKDNANVLCLSSWDIAKSGNLETILDTWFKSEYDGDSGRLKMLEIFDSW